MKIHLLLLALLLNFIGFSQTKETYYDFSWKPCVAEDARYVGILEKTDSGWLRKDFYVTSSSLQMQALYEDEACKMQNGFYFYFFASGNLSRMGRRIHGNQEGLCISYHSNGMMADSALFHDGRVVDKRIQWHRNGYMSDSITRLNDSTEVEIGWFDDGTLAYAGYLVNGKPNGKWKYYHHNGQVSAMETYETGKRMSAEYFDESGSPQRDTSNVNKEADFKDGTGGWKKYLSKHLYWPPNLQFSKSAAVTVGVDFTVDEDGKVIDAEVSLPLHPDFDKIALDIVKKSPPWIPATAHNRKVKAYRRQPITFEQGD